MNGYRKVAEFVRNNKIIVKKRGYKGNSGGFDDRVTLNFYKGSHMIKSIDIKSFYKKPIDPVKLLNELQIELEELQTIGVFDEETLIDYLVTHHTVDGVDTNDYQ